MNTSSKMKLICFTFLVLLLGIFERAEGAIKTIDELVAQYDYQIIRYNTTTTDGVTIELHRLCPKSGCPTSPKGVVFMQHGMLCTSAVWVIESTNRSLGYLLSKANFDVWLGNIRGTTYGTNNLTDYDFTLYQHAVKDLPIQIDTVLHETGRESLYYVCHSQGCPQLYMLLSLKPEYNTKIIAMAAMAGPRTMQHLSDVSMKAFLFFAGLVTPPSLVLQHNDAASWIEAAYCQWFGASCKSIMNLFFGSGLKYVDKMTEMQQDDVTTYKYLLSSQNKKYYNSTTNQRLDQSNIRVRGNLYYSTGDDIAPSQEIMDVQRALTNSCLVRVPKNDTEFTHMNYILNSQGDALQHNTHIVSFFLGCADNSTSCTVENCPSELVADENSS